MLRTRLQHMCFFASALLLCGACSTPGAERPTPQVQPSSPAVVTAAPVASAAPPATAVPDTRVAVEATAAAVPQVARGETVLTLLAGSSNSQVGIAGSGNDLNGPRAFRIGSDGSIRLLDAAKKRLLFFTTDGTLTRTLDIANVNRVTDFIVNTSGEIFILVTLDDEQTKILHYNPAGAVVEQIAINDVVGLSADGIMLTAQGWILLVQGNTRSWVIRHNAVDTPPSLQALTERDAVPTPRSPVLFGNTADATGTLEVRILGPVNDALIQTSAFTTEAPATTSFFNVDRAMNVYTASDFSQPQVDLYRLAPDGSVLGSARIDARGCASTLRSWRSYYIDQGGSAWAMCTSDRQVTLTRYSLRDQYGQPLPEAAPTPADVAWKPGANSSAA